MTLGDQYVYKCPTCGNLLFNNSLMSGNLYGAKFYSDGKMNAPMLREFPNLTKCQKCNTFLWLSKMDAIDSVNYGLLKKTKWKDAEPVQFLDVDDLFKVLESSLIENKQDEKSVRIRIWRTFNDRMRDNPTYHFDEADEQRWISNINKLIPLLNSSDDGQAIILAELHRNLGEFERCTEILNTITDKEYNHDIKTIRLNCLFENRWVVQIQYD